MIIFLTRGVFYYTPLTSSPSSIGNKQYSLSYVDPKKVSSALLFLLHGWEGSTSRVAANFVSVSFPGSVNVCKGGFENCTLLFDCGW